VEFSKHHIARYHGGSMHPDQYFIVLWDRLFHFSELKDFGRP
jgi:hypothetical protein